jgi:hypothetical protein
MRREAETGLDICGLQIGKIFADLFMRIPGSQKIENIFDPDPHAANAGPSATLIGTHRNSISDVHALTIPENDKISEGCF